MKNQNIRCTWRRPKSAEEIAEMMKMAINMLGIE